jgi:hypothetical protein
MSSLFRHFRQFLYPILQGEDAEAAVRALAKPCKGASARPRRHLRERGAAGALDQHRQQPAQNSQAEVDPGQGADTATETRAGGVLRKLPTEAPPRAAQQATNTPRSPRKLYSM